MIIDCFTIIKMFISPKPSSRLNTNLSNTQNIMRVHELDIPFLNLQGGEKSQVTIKKKEQVEEWRLFY